MAYLTADDAAAFERCVTGGGVVLFGADTVYGLACDAGNAATVARLYELKGRPADKPAALMAFSMPVAELLLAHCGPRTRAAAWALLPGAVTLILPGLGMRFPALPPELAALGGVAVAVMQTSANRSGGPEARTLADVDDGIVAGVDLVLDCGTLAGTASTVIDLRELETSGLWGIVRAGAVTEAEISAKLVSARLRNGGAGFRGAQMRVAMASDHAGFHLKEHVKGTLMAAGHEVLDVGTGTSESVDYPQFASEAAELVAAGEADAGVLACGSGNGVAIVANKVAGVRAVNAHDVAEAEMSRRHNDANVVTLSGARLSPELADRIVATFLRTDFEGGRHARRVEQIESLGAV